MPAVEIPKELQNNKFVQLLLITVEYQTERANNANAQLQTANGQIAELQTDRNQWKNLFLDERRATTELQVSLAESRNESAQLRIANQVAANQRELDKNFISTQESEIRRLKRSRWKYAAAGFAAGFATGVPSGALIAVKFNF